MSAALVNVETGEVVGRTGSNGHADLNHIKIIDRHRTDLGDIDALAKSIREVGLLHPIVVDGNLRLIAGHRRLEACRKLGHPTVPVRIVRQVNDAAKALMAERDENTCRKAMTPTEMRSLTDAILEIERPQAAERKAATQAQPGNDGRNPTGGGPRATSGPEQGRSRERAAKAAGWSATTYRRVSKVQDAAANEDYPEEIRDLAAGLIVQMDADKITPHAAEDLLNEALAEIKPAAAPTPSPSTEERVATARKMAAENYTSRQIESALGFKTRSGLTDFLKRHGIDVPADAVVGNRTRRIDSNRAMNQTVMALDAQASSLDLIDFDELDSSQLEGWVTSLSDSLRSLNRFHKQLKEMTHE